MQFKYTKVLILKCAGSCSSSLQTLDGGALLNVNITYGFGTEDRFRRTVQ